MKKLLSLFLILALLLSFSACTLSGLDSVAEDLSEAAEDLNDAAQELSDAAQELTDELATIGDRSEATDAPEEETTTAADTDPTEDSTTAGGEELPYEDTVAAIDPEGTYTSKEDVALYIHTYGHLPNNFITKKEAKALGWKSGSLEKYAPGKCIGGDRFGNYEGLLPKAPGRTYTECDIDTLGASKRGAKRIVFSNDGLIYYTGDHYESFTLLYGEE